MTAARTGFDPNVAIAASHNGLAARPRTTVREHASGAEPSISAAVDQSLIKRAMRRPARRLFRVTRAVLRVPAHRFRAYLVDDMKHDLWLQMTLGTNHLNQEIERLHAENELISRDIRRLTVLVARLVEQQSHDVGGSVLGKSTMTAQLDSIRALTQRTEAELTRRTQESLAALLSIEGMLQAALDQGVVTASGSDVPERAGGGARPTTADDDQRIGPS